MNPIHRILLTVSLVFCLICLGACIWIASVLRDTTSYCMAGFLLLAVIWIAVNLLRSRPKNEE